ncbi:MAG: CRTAC1 family protein, partial [Bacteroidota bacterium]
EGIMRDFDNDGFVDILTATATYLFHNNGDKTFTEVPNPFGGGNLSTFASGDLNHDGFQDLYVAFEGNAADRLLLNEGNNGNHFLGVQLQGVQSNKAGVGSRIEIHGNWGIQIREVRSGESYGISNSLTQHFGLGQDSVIDYLIVRWTSGVVDVVKKPAADQFLTVVEGSTCTLSGFELELSGSNLLCLGDSVTLSAPVGYQYLWNNGLNSQSLTVSGAGNFSLIMVDGNGCAARSNLVQVLVNPDQTPTISHAGETAFCEGASVMLTSSESASYTWSTGETSQSITVAQQGDYFVSVPGACGDFTSEMIHVEVYPAASAPQVSDLTLPAPGSATL